MNSNELNKAVMKIVQQQIEPIVTEYLQQHPEYFHPSESGNCFISNYNITLSFQPKILKDVADVKPTVFIELGNLDRGHKLICFDHNPEELMSVFCVDSRWVTDQEVPNE
jgi:hypothetical protein